MKYSEWINFAVEKLLASDSSKRDAEILLQHVTRKSRTFIFAFPETEINIKEEVKLALLLQRRELGEPIAYLIGEREFWSLPFYVSSATLIPRPDTECLVEQALARLPKYTSRVLDLGTGTGVIALAIASECQKSKVVGLDFNFDAVSLALKNQQRLAINNVHFLQSDWFTSLSGQYFDIIVSNPPYIDKKDCHLQQGDVRFEPLTALVADKQGISHLSHIIDKSRSYLKSKGWLLVEHGWQQSVKIHKLFKHYGYKNIESCQDYSGQDRIILGQWY
ncbi:Release factor glutamine methyltransferase [Candidatus Hartigia pinicola]|nr:Release factor glutamine methyltransferase [Candidatus Hartigia pinicola]